MRFVTCSTARDVPVLPAVLPLARDMLSRRGDSARGEREGLRSLRVIALVLFGLLVVGRPASNAGPGTGDGGGLLLLFSAFKSGAGSTARQSLTGSALQAVDGHTIRVRIADRIENVRYIGINASARHSPTPGGQPGDREATKANRRLVEGRLVRLDLDAQERDRDGRLLAYVYVGEMMVNAELVARGYAQVLTVPPNLKHQELFLKLQRHARLLKVGLWADPEAKR